MTCDLAGLLINTIHLFWAPNRTPQSFLFSSSTITHLQNEVNIRSKVSKRFNTSYGIREPNDLTDDGIVSPEDSLKAKELESSLKFFAAEFTLQLLQLRL